MLDPPFITLCHYFVSLGDEQRQQHRLTLSHSLPLIGCSEPPPGGEAPSNVDLVMSVVFTLNPKAVTQSQSTGRAFHPFSVAPALACTLSLSPEPRALSPEPRAPSPEPC